MKEGLVLTYLLFQRDAVVMVKETGLQAGTHSCRRPVGLVFQHVHLRGHSVSKLPQQTLDNLKLSHKSLIFFHFSCCFSLDSFYLLLCQIHAGGRCHVCGCSSVINYLLTMCKALNLTSIVANIYCFI